MKHMIPAQIPRAIPRRNVLVARALRPVGDSRFDSRLSERTSNHFCYLLKICVLMSIFIFLFHSAETTDFQPTHPRRN
jgi:hypothetical protein